MMGANQAAFVLDATCLIHFCRADRLDVLRDCLGSDSCWSTTVVQDELDEGASAGHRVPGGNELDWLRFHALGDLEELLAYGSWVRRMGSRRRNRGEASVCAAAQLLGGGAIAIIDDKNAKAVACANGVEARGTLWLLARACRVGKLTTTGASSIVGELHATGMRLPCTGPGFESWAREAKLL